MYILYIYINVKLYRYSLFSCLIDLNAIHYYNLGNITVEL